MSDQNHLVSGVGIFFTTMYNNAFISTISAFLYKYFTKFSVRNSRDLKFCEGQAGEGSLLSPSIHSSPFHSSALPFPSLLFPLHISFPPVLPANPAKQRQI